MAIVRLPIVASIDPESIFDTAVSEGEGTKNTLYSKYTDGRTYVTQRPALTFFVTDDTGISPGRARGIFYWEVTGTTYIVNGDTIYKGGYGEIVDTIRNGRDPVIFIPYNPKTLILIDPETDSAWVIDETDTVTLIDEINFPGPTDPTTGFINSFPTDLVGGGSYLDGYIFLMDKQGVIWNSLTDIEANLFDDPLNPGTPELTGPGAAYWNPINRIVAERDSDEGVYLTKQGEHLVAIGTNTIEFFYDAAQPTGSPLQRRPDISYRVGAFSTTAVFNGGERIYFIGSEFHGTLGAYAIQDFKLQKISDDAMDGYLNNALIRNLTGGGVLATGGAIGEHNDIVYFTMAGLGTGQSYDPKYTLVYDGTYETWSTWDTGFASLKSFPVIAVSSRFGNTRRSQFLLMLDGSVAELKLHRNPVDSRGEGDYFVEDYFVPDYFEVAGSGDSSAIEMVVRLSDYDGDTMTKKFCHRLELVGIRVAKPFPDDVVDDTPVQVRWSDDHYHSWSNYRNLTTSNDRWKLTRLGMFDRRAFEIKYKGTDFVRIEAIELDIRASQYA